MTNVLGIGNGMTMDFDDVLKNTTLKHTKRHLTLNNTNTNAAIVIRTGTTTNATDFLVENNSGADLLDIRGNKSIALGKTAGSGTADAVAIGTDAGAATQGTACVAIGKTAGQNSQNNHAIAIGNNAAPFTGSSQGIDAIAIGSGAALNTGQENYCVAIGNGAALSDQRLYSVALGYTLGDTTFGANSVGIGFEAGKVTMDQQCIVLNASGATVNTGGIGRCYIRPLRPTTVTGTTNPFANNIPANHKVLIYNPTTYEVAYWNI